VLPCHKQAMIRNRLDLTDSLEVSGRIKKHLRERERNECVRKRNNKK